MRFAVVGCGHLGAIHARKLASCPTAQLTHAIDPCADNRSRVARETGATPLASLNELDVAIDAAIVATPTRTHYEVARTLLDRGVHLFVEKPLTPTAREAEALCSLAQKRNCVLQVGHVERFNPAYTAIRANLKDPKYIETRRTSGFSFRSVDIGAVFDLMIHDIDLVLDLVDSEVTGVSAFGCAMLGNREDTAQARLEFASGCVADLHASRVSSTRTRQMQVLAPEYRASIDFAELTAVMTTPSDSLRDGDFDAEAFTPDERKRLGPHHFETLFHHSVLPVEPLDAIDSEHADFLGAIAGQSSPCVDGRSAQRSVQVAELILEAIGNHQWDGDSTGRMGPHFAHAPRIIRPDWNPAETSAPKRMAG